MAEQFQKGDVVLRTYHGIGGYEEHSIRQIAKVENGVAYVSDHEVDENGNADLDNFEWGITYDAATGMEKELFFPGVYMTIVPVI